MQNVQVQPHKHSNLFINAVSVVVPLVVAVLLAIPTKLDLGAWTRLLPHAIGAINTLTSIALVLGLIFILRRNINAHRATMTTAFAMGALFLVFYVAYHLTNESVRYNGAGFWRGFYLFVLLTHIALSLVVLPLVLRAWYFAVTNQYARHVKIVRWAYPIWLYVSITGVIVYAMAHGRALLQ